MLPGEVRANKLSLTQPGEQRLKGDFRTTINGRAGGMLARTGSLSGHPSKQQLRSTLLDPVILRKPLYPLHYAIAVKTLKEEIQQF
ncbi:hypothetical protein J6590_074013 [Homalodisca vitripennis]|nr:hypothetical protein J6590_074013 [Homalodisca vitripennis]